MEKLHRLKAALSNIANPKKVILEYFGDEIVQAEILDKNIANLYERGQDAEGVLLHPYTENTVHIKMMKGQPYNRTTLKDEGDFYDSFIFKLSRAGFEISAQDPKTGNLAFKYGDDIFGLNEGDVQEVKKSLLAYFRQVFNF